MGNALELKSRRREQIEIQKQEDIFLKRLHCHDAVRMYLFSHRERNQLFTTTALDQTTSLWSAFQVSTEQVERVDREQQAFRQHVMDSKRPCSALRRWNQDVVVGKSP